MVHADTFCRDHLPPVDQQPEFLFDLPELHYPARLNCATRLLDDADPDRPCLRTDTETWTYGELQRRSNQIAHVLVSDYGLVPGNRVLLRGPNNPWLVAAWFGVLKAGGVVVTTMPLLRAGEVATLIELTLPMLLISDSRFLDDLSGVGTPILSYPGDLAARCATKPDTFTAVDTAADDVALLATTSGTTGRAVPGFQAAILDSDGHPVADGVPGRLAVKGPTGCRYLADRRQQIYVHNGWNVTGDTFVRDADGYFWYQGRTDDMIISAGYNIAGPEVEDALAGHPDVAEVAVVGVPDPDRGMIVKAFVVLRPGVTPGDAQAAELQGFVKQAIAPYKYPRAVEFLTALPKTSTGKVQRYKLRQG